MPPFDDSVFTAISSLLAAAVFALGFTALRWRSEAEARIDYARQVHDSLLENVRSDNNVSVLRVMKRMSKLWSQTTWFNLKPLQRVPRDPIQSAAVVGLFLAVGLCAIGALYAKWRPGWPPDIAWWSAMGILLAYGGVLVASIIDRNQFKERMQKEFSLLPLVRLYLAEIKVPHVVGYDDTDKLLQGWALAGRPIASTDKIYWGDRIKDVEDFVIEYPEVPWAHSILGRYNLWTALRLRLTPYFSDYAELARKHLEEAVKGDGEDPIARLVLLRLLECLGESRRLETLMKETKSCLEKFGQYELNWELRTWYLPEDHVLRKELLPWLPNAQEEVELKSRSVAKQGSHHHSEDIE